MTYALVQRPMDTYYVQGTCHLSAEWHDEINYLKKKKKSLEGDMKLY